MDLSDDERAFLLGMRALTINERGEEVYVGLTREESVEFLRLTRLNEGGRLPTADEPQFSGLQEKHEGHRQAVVEGLEPQRPGSRLSKDK